VILFKQSNFAGYQRSAQNHRLRADV